MAAANSQIRILTVDDHAILREGVTALIANHSDMVVVAEASTGHEAIEQYRQHRPDITLMDLGLPDMNGVDAIAQIREEFPKARVIVLTTYRGDIQALRSFKAGAVGYLLKSMIRKELVDIIRIVHQGGKWIPPEVATEMAAYAGEESLTAREVEVLRHVAEGSANKTIADRLNISEDTVKAHMRNILSKLSANDRTHAVTIAMRRGFLDLSR